MATLFTRIIRGELPGHFVWRDDRCVAFLSIHPLQPGHTLVVPIQEAEHWLDLDPELLAHLMEVARRVGKVQQQLFPCAKVGLVAAGLEVPHVHFHVVPINEGHDLDFARADTSARGEELARNAQRIKAAL